MRLEKRHLGTEVVEMASLCYTRHTLENTSSLSAAPLCNQCGSKLIRLTKKTKKIEGQKFPITIVTFKCSDKDCQKRIDKERRERLKKELERAEKKQPRK